MNSFETCSIDTIEELQLQQFKTYLGDVLAGSNYYARVFREARLTVEDITSWRDLHRIPALETKTVVERNNELVAVPKARLRRVMVSGGTTGHPKVCFLSDNQSEIVETWAAVWQAAELTKDDVAAVLCPLPLASGIIITEMLESIGCATLPLGLTTPPEFAARLMRTLGATVITTQPSTLSHFTERHRALDVQPQSLQIRKIFLGSEVLTAKTRRRVEREWGAEVFDTSGSSEVGMIGSECTQHDGHHLAVGSAHFEVLDASTGEPLREGVGRLFVTTLLNLGLPLIRYDMKDVVRITHQPCRCGRTTPRIWFMGRSDDRVTLKTGVKLHSYQLDSAFGDIDALTTSYNVIITGDERRDRVKVVMEVEPTALRDRNLREAVVRAVIKSSVDFDEIYTAGLVELPEVEFVAIGTLERTPRGKIKDRFKDQRAVTT